jgi:soluble lytic murein transglycosylase
LWLALELRVTSARALPYPDVEVALRSVYEGEPLLETYRAVEAMTRRGDVEGLSAFVAAAPESFLRYRALLALARDVRVPMARRAAFYEQVLAAGLLEPLAREEVRVAHLEVARVAELAGQTQRALEAYARALPLPEAARGVARLEPDAEARARLLLRHGAPADARRALERAPEPPPPLLAARVYRALGEHEAALTHLDRLLQAEPAHLEGRTERAWVLLALGRTDEAEAAFGSLDDVVRTRGLAALAAARGAYEEAGEHYAHLAELSGEAGALWLATEMLERSGQPEAALPLYLELAQQRSPYRVDAAYRALVLAERLGDAARAQRAEALLPEDAYFGALRHGLPELLPASRLERATPEALELAAALARVGDREAAVGELLVALAAARGSEAETVALAEALQHLGEFRRSAQAATRWVERGSRDPRTWHLAFPRAYAGVVQRYAAAWGVEPELVWAVMRQESAFYPRAVSTSRAMGLMQIVPATWAWLAELLGDPSADPFNVADNVRFGTFYLGTLMDLFGGDLERVVTAYNGGPGYIGAVDALEAVQRDPEAFYRLIDRQETRDYLQRVMWGYLVYRDVLGDVQVARSAP